MNAKMTEVDKTTEYHMTRIYKSKKTQRLYVLCGEAIDATNEHDGQIMVLYAPCSGPNVLYARVASEFVEKFEPFEFDAP